VHHQKGLGGYQIVEERLGGDQAGNARRTEQGSKPWEKSGRHDDVHARSSTGHRGMWERKSTDEAGLRRTASWSRFLGFACFFLTLYALAFCALALRGPIV
jgi:hypothetical protein